MNKRSFGIALFAFMFAITMAGCGSMCGPKKVAEEAPPPPPAVYKPAPQPPPAPVQPAPPIKKGRN
jgi:hypothetical protein